MDCCREEIPLKDQIVLKKGGNNNYRIPTKGSLCMIYATRPGDSAYEEARMTVKFIEHMEKCL